METEINIVILKHKMIIMDPKTQENPADFQVKKLFDLKESEISKDYKIVMDWLENFLAKPHPKLGREGHVCPFIHNAIKENSIWIVEVDIGFGMEKIEELIINCTQLFRTLPKTNSKEVLLNCLLLTFPANGDKETTELIKSVQSNLKPYFVSQGLMIGEFYESNSKPGLHNKHFHPLQSPIPILAIRTIVESDLLFLTRKSDPPELRVKLISSYLEVLSTRLSFTKFNEAKDALAEAIEDLRFSE